MCLHWAAVQRLAPSCTRRDKPRDTERAPPTACFFSRFSFAMFPSNLKEIGRQQLGNSCCAGGRSRRRPGGTVSSVVVRRRLGPQQLNAVGASMGANRSTFYSPDLPPMRPPVPPRLLACGLAMQIEHSSFSGNRAPGRTLAVRVYCTVI